MSTTSGGTSSPGFVVLPGGSELLQLGGGLMMLLASADRTAGALGAWIDEVPSGGSLPLHIHHRCDEFFHVAEGEFLFQLGATTTVAPAGSFVFAGRGIPHAYLNIGAATGRLFGFVTPGGLEEFYRAQARYKAEEMTFELYSQLAANYDFDIVGPRLVTPSSA